jgi:hypothetical protein
MKTPFVAPTVKPASEACANTAVETVAQTPEIQALVPTNIQVERIQTVGVGKIPQIIYKTPKGRCSTLLSKQQFLTIWQCWLDIRLLKSGKIKAWEILPTGLKLNTNQGKFWLSFPEATAFLSRYNRVAIEPLSVKFNHQGAVVWNPIHQTLSQVKETGCSCADSRYRHTICKHQIAVQVCRIKPV